MAVRLEAAGDRAMPPCVGSRAQVREEARMGKKDDVDQEKGGKKGLLTLLLAAAGGAFFFLKKKREQELDEALWEEPRPL